MDSGAKSSPTAPPPAPNPPQGTPVPRVRSHALLGGRGALIIEHHGREYYLRITPNGKLILTA